MWLSEVRMSRRLTTISSWLWLRFSTTRELSSAFPVENRATQATTRVLKNHLDRTKNLPFVKRISDFHLLFFLARFLDLSSDVPALAECVQTQAAIPEGYQLLLDSLANTS